MLKLYSRCWVFVEPQELQKSTPKVIVYFFVSGASILIFVHYMKQLPTLKVSTRAEKSFGKGMV